MTTLQRVGTFVSADPPTTPPSAAPAGGPLSTSLSSFARPTGADLAAEAAAAAAPAPAVEPVEEPCGLTPASLKHLRRQRDALSEEKTRLQAELTSVKAQLPPLQTQVEEQRQQLAELEQSLQESQERELEQRQRADTLHRENGQLEQSLARQEKECSLLQQALKDQQQLTRDVCEAAERRPAAPARAPAAPEVDKSRERELEQAALDLRRERDALARDLKLETMKQAEMQASVATAMAAAEKAMALHHQWEQLRSGKLAEAINQKIALHISVPRVTLSYNNAPPVLVSAAAALSKERIRGILESDIFPHFDPMWVRLDDIEQAPDGTSKKNYSTKMLETLTQAVKVFLVKSQQADVPPGTDTSIFEDSETDAPSVALHRAGPHADEGHLSSAAPPSMGARFGDTDRAAAVPPRGGGACAGHFDSATRGGLPAGGPAGSAACGGRSALGEAGKSGRGNDLADADRSRLLELLRLGDDQGLDSKLSELLNKRGGR